MSDNLANIIPNQTPSPSPSPIPVNWFNLGSYFQLSPTFWGGIIIGFVTGIGSGFVANILTKKWQERKLKNTGYLATEVADGFILFNGKIKNTKTSQSAVNRLTKIVEQ